MTDLDKISENISLQHIITTKQLNWYFLVIKGQTNKTVYDKVSTPTKKQNDKFTKKDIIMVNNLLVNLIYIKLNQLRSQNSGSKKPKISIITLKFAIKAFVDILIAIF